MRRWLGALLICVCCFGASAPARADSLDKVLSLLHAAGLIDGAVVDAKPLVQCLINGGSLTQCEQLVPVAEVGSPLNSGDPKLRLVVDVMRHAGKGEWIEVLELTGTELLVQVACTAGLPAGGRLRDFICGGVFGKVASKARPVVHRVLVAVKSGHIDDWLAVAALVGPELACELVPDEVEGKDLLCSTLAQVLGQSVAMVKAAAEAVWGSLQRVGEWITGQNQHMPVDTYYALRWQPWYHYGTLARMYGGWDGLMNRLHPPCVKYFDDHTMSPDNARKTCDRLRTRFSEETATFEQALRAGSRAHVHTVAFPFAEIFAVTDFGVDSAVPAHRRLVENTCASSLRQTLSFPQPDPAVCQRIANAAAQMPGFAAGLNALHQRCLEDQVLQAPEPTVQQRLCVSVGDSFVNALRQEAMRVEQAFMQLQQGGHCQTPAGWKRRDGARLVCSDYRAHQQCLTAFAAAHPEQRCSFDRDKADARLAGQLVEALGGRSRCGRVAGDRIRCTRPWKRPQCDALLAQARRQGEYAQTPLSCVYEETAEFRDAQARAKEILEALNRPLSEPGGRMQMRRKGDVTQLLANCQLGQDPLKISCADPGRYTELAQRLPGAQLPICAPDPNNNGADAPCWAGQVQLPEGLPGGAQQTLPGVPGQPLQTLPGYGLTAPKILDRVRLGGVSGSWERTVVVPTSGLQRLRNGLCRVPIGIDLRASAELPAGRYRVRLQSGDAETTVAVPALGAQALVPLDSQLALPEGQRRIQASLLDGTGEVLQQRTLSLRLEGSCG